MSSKRASAPALGKRERNKADKLSRITAAARELFFRQGYEGTTTEAVAKLAGIGAGTLFAYAKTKEELLQLVSIGDLLQVAAQSRMRAQRRKDLLSRVHTLYLGLLEYHFAHPQLSRHLVKIVMFSEDPERQHERERLTTLLTGSVAEFVRDAAARGTIPADTDAGRLAENCFAIYYRTMLTSILSGALFERTAVELRARLALQLQPLQVSSRA